jgi:multidrug efflux pump subunit AcrB
MKMINDPNTGIIAWFARNHVAANLLMIVIVIAGLVSAFNMRTQVNPDLESNTIAISVPYPGAAPAEVESSVVQRLEEAMESVEGIETMYSNAREGMASISLSVDNSYDIQVVFDEVKLAIDRVASLPAEIEQPVISRSFKQMGAVNVQVFGNLSERGMKELAIEVRDEILGLPSVTKAELQGARAYEIAIEVEESKLQQYGLTLNQVSQAIRNSSIDLGAGSIKTDSGDIMLRTQGQAYDQFDFEQLILVTGADGTRINLGDVATVTDGFIESDFFSLFNGKPSVGITVSAVADQNQIDITREVKAYIKRKQQSMPQGIFVEAWMDSTEYLSTTINMMLSNMMFGIILVLIVLGLFLRIQLAFWVMLGMPIAFLGAFALLPQVGGSINMISMFGFILVLGIVVDDAIIIGESAQSSLENHGHSVDSIVLGAKRVAIPATFGVLTTIATFTPMVFVPGSFGAIPGAIGWVVILCLIFSIVESKLILPAHLASMRPLPAFDPHTAGPVRKFQEMFANGLKQFIEHVYGPFLNKAINNRYIAGSIFIAMLILAIGFVAGPYVRTQIFPNLSGDVVRAEIELVEGSSSAQTVRVVKEVADHLVALNDAADEDSKFLQNYMAFTNDANGSIMVDLVSGEDVNPEIISNQWREAVGEIAGTKKLEFRGMQRTSGGDGDGDIGFRLVGSDVEKLKAAAIFLQQTLRDYDGIYEVQNSADGAIPEMKISLEPSGEALGLTLRDLANQVRAAFFGVEAQRIQRAGEEVRVMVRYPKEKRASLGNLENMLVATPDGERVPFTAVAHMDQFSSPSSIRRVEGKRTVEVNANIDASRAQPGKIWQDISSTFQQTLDQRFPGVRLELGGTAQMEEELIDYLYYGGALGLFAIYALMAIPLRSYLQPLIIMGVIPFGMIGALIGHMLLDIPFSALSMLGLVALAGVVVNDSIILVDFINKSMAFGTPLKQAVIGAGKERFRAIMLTSLTTFFGLLPILTETNLAAQLVIPMAVSLGFGIVFATLITLVFIPCLYLILEDAKRLLGFSRTEIGHDRHEELNQTI